MTPFTTIRSVAAPLLRENIDTDIIIRVEPLFSGVPRNELGPYCFESWRYLDDKTENPDFVMNREPYRSAQILLAGANFGCGSSREGAVWALMAMGIRCVIAPSFGDIFFNNCFQNGMLPVRMAQPAVQALAAQVQADPASQVTVDLEACTVTAPDGAIIGFDISATRREALLEGLDAIALTRKREPLINDFQQTDAVRRPWIYRFG
jgi:3-isopropylmalate/(R)-2-methylmalate dehydratase small subunit